MSNNQTQNAEAAEVLAPATTEIQGGGKTYKVVRLETRQIWPILRCALPIFGALTALVGADEKPAAESPPLGSSSPAGQPPEVSPLAKVLGPEAAAFLEAIAEHGERITEVVAIGLDEKISTVGKFEPQETYLALRAIIEVNKDFFTHRVAPLLGLQLEGMERKALGAAVTQAVQSFGAGPTPSSN